MSVYELTVDLETYQVEPGEWRATGVDAPVLVFASSPEELERETARVLLDYVDLIAKHRPDEESFESQCRALGFDFWKSDVECDAGGLPRTVYFVVSFSERANRRTYDQKVTAVLQGCLA